MPVEICSACHESLSKPLTTTAVEWTSDMVAAATRGRGAKSGSGPSVLHCSFCGRTRNQVKKMLAGHDGVYICDGCVELCRHIVESGD